MAERLKERYFGGEEHPYQTLERELERHLQDGHTLLDAGCGRTAPMLVKYRLRARRLIGVDVIPFETPVEGVELLNSDLSHIPIETASADIVVCRSVMEHLEHPLSVYHEIHRVLKPGGRFLFLTPNLWDYASLIATLIPSRFQPWIVSMVEGRKEEDVFPVRYRTNTRGAVRKLARQAGYEIESFRYLGQYPSYFMFNGFLFLLATGYEKLLRRFKALSFLRGWILVSLRKR